MAHQIETHGNRAAALFARTDPWHRLGTTVAGEAFTAQDAMTLGHLGGWNVRTAPVSATEIGEDGVTTTFPAGFVHLPKIDAEFIQQLCAEQLITRRDRNGFPVREWQKMRERNEALDCYVYARAAAAAAGLDRFEERHWRELERQLGVAPPPEEPPPLHDIELNEATPSGGLAASGTRNTGRRVIRSRWLR